jgi:hypothetical protein
MTLEGDDAGGVRSLRQQVKKVVRYKGCHEPFGRRRSRRAPDHRSSWDPTAWPSRSDARASRPRRRCAIYFELTPTEERGPMPGPAEMEIDAKRGVHTLRGVGA